MTRGADYWMGSLAMTVAWAANEPNPRPILKSAIREFLRDCPDTELARMLREQLREKP